MKHLGRSLVLVIALAVAVPVMAGEGKSCSHPTQDCLNYMADNLKDRGWVGLEMADESMKISRVVEGSPAEKAGFEVGDVLTAVNGVSYSEENQEKLNKIKHHEMKAGNTVTYTVERSGHAKKIDVTLAELPETVMAQWVGGHMLEHAEVKVASN